MQQAYITVHITTGKFYSTQSGETIISREFLKREQKGLGLVSSVWEGVNRGKTDTFPNALVQQRRSRERKELNTTEK